MTPNALLSGVRHQMFLDSLRQTQTLPAAQLDAYQTRLLEKLLRHARETVPFYRDRLDPVFGPDDRFLRERFEEIPLLTRSDAQADPGALETRNHPGHAGEIVSDQTSGSTGQAFLHKRSALADVASRAMSERMYEWNGLVPTRRTALIRVDRDGLAGPPLGRREGNRYELGIDADVATQLVWLREMKPDYLVSYASNVRALALALIGDGETMPLERVLTVSETLDAETRDLCRQAFGCEISDNYGTQENGYLAGECGICGAYHVASEAALVEILDEDGQPVAPGEIGRVVVTGLYNYAMPFIRYAVGDYAQRAAEYSGCPRTLPRLSRIMGRQRNMFTFPGGRVVWPNAVFRKFKTFLPIKQLQIVQEAPLEIAVRYVRDPNGVDTDMPGLEAYLRERLDPRISIRLDERDALHRSAGGKYEDYLSLVSA